MGGPDALLICHTFPPPQELYGGLRYTRLVGHGFCPDSEIVPLEIFPGFPASVRADWIQVTKEGLVRRAPSCCINRGPVQLPRIDNPVQLPWTGQMSVEVAPKATMAPLWS